MFLTLNRYFCTLNRYFFTFNRYFFTFLAINIQRAGSERTDIYIGVTGCDVTSLTLAMGTRGIAAAVCPAELSWDRPPEAGAACDGAAAAGCIDGTLAACACRQTQQSGWIIHVSPIVTYYCTYFIYAS